MKIGDYVFTPRFCMVRIEGIYDTIQDARKSGYKEPTYYENDEYVVVGKTLDMYHMEFAAYHK